MKKPRLTDADRLAIETSLKSRKTVYIIAKALSRPVTTIAREIKARAVESDKGAAHHVTNRCAFKMECERRHICAYCLYDGKRQCCASSAASTTRTARRSSSRSAAGWRSPHSSATDAQRSTNAS